MRRFHLRGIRPLSALCVLLFLAGAARAAPAADPLGDPKYGVDGRIGVMLSTQVLDGPGPQLGLGWRWRFAGGWTLLAESGAIRTQATQVTAVIPALGGAATIRGDVEQWTVPVLSGLGWSRPRASGRWGIELLGGLAIGRTRTLTGVPSSGAPRREAFVSIDPMVKGRLEWSWRIRPGAVTLAGGWQHHFRPGTPTDPDLRITGPFLEAGWRVQF